MARKCGDVEVARENLARLEAIRDSETTPSREKVAASKLIHDIWRQAREMPELYDGEATPASAPAEQSGLASLRVTG